MISAMDWARSANISASSALGVMTPVAASVRESSRMPRMRSPSGGASGVAREYDRAAALFQPRGEALDLRGLAGAVEALEGDEGAGHSYQCKSPAKVALPTPTNMKRSLGTPASRDIPP